LKKQKDSVPFNLPVDPVALKILHYPSIIKNPMDFTTIERKLASSNPAKPDLNPSNPRYYSADEFIADVRLVFSNTLTFNGPEHSVTVMGKRLEEFFDRSIKNLPPAEVVCTSLPFFILPFIPMSSHPEATETSSCQESRDTSPSPSSTKESSTSQTICLRSCHQTIRSGADWPS
jgi:bromodomain-containing factor 1